MTGTVTADDDLSVVLSEFARTLLTDFPIKGILDHLVRRIVDILPIDAAGVSLMSPTTDPRLIAGSDESATRYEHLQTELGEGPCIDAYESDGPIAVPDLAKDARFPTFAQRAIEEGLVAVFTFPLRNDGRTLGVLDLYRTTSGALDQRDMRTAQTLADVATAYLLNTRSREGRSEFVAAVSHELRTPMTSIAGFAEMLLDGEAGVLTQAQQNYVGRIKSSSDRLTALADDLLALSSLESDASVHEHEALDLGLVLAEVKAALGPTIAAGRIDVSFDIPTEPVCVCGNARDLGSLLSNLLSNAIKFTDDRGWARCSLHVVGGQARVEVSDNGLGIPQSEQRDLFTRFFRSSTAQSHAIQGFGLGLTIVASIVKNHRGDIAVRSAHLGGTTVTINLPMLTGARCDQST